MKIHDINPEHRLALVEQPAPGGQGVTFSYVPLTDGMADALVDEPYYDYLKQRHYIARAHPQGLVINHVDDMLDGWQQLEGHWMHGADLKQPSRSTK